MLKYRNKIGKRENHISFFLSISLSTILKQPDSSRLQPRTIQAVHARPSPRMPGFANRRKQRLSNTRRSPRTRSLRTLNATNTLKRTRPWRIAKRADAEAIVFRETAKNAIMKAEAQKNAAKGEMEIKEQHIAVERDRAGQQLADLAHQRSPHEDRRLRAVIAQHCGRYSR